MRVCVVYDCLYPYTVGGGERWYRNLAERLVEDARNEVTYVTLRQWDRAAKPELAEGRVRVISAGPRMGLYTERRPPPDLAADRVRPGCAVAPAAPRPTL